MKIIINDKRIFAICFILIQIFRKWQSIVVSNSKIIEKISFYCFLRIIRTDKKNLLILQKR